MCLVRLVCCFLLVLGMRFVAGYWLKRLGTMAKKAKMTKKLRKRIPKAPLLRGFFQFSHAPALFFCWVVSPEVFFGLAVKRHFWSCCQTAAGEAFTLPEGGGSPTRGWGCRGWGAHFGAIHVLPS